MSERPFSSGMQVIIVDLSYRKHGVYCTINSAQRLARTRSGRGRRPRQNAAHPRLAPEGAARDAGGTEELLHRLDERRVVAAVDDLADACVDDELRAGEAGGDRHVDRRVGDVDAVPRRLAQIKSDWQYANS